MSQEWNVGIWNPCADIGNCLWGWFIPCWLHGNTVVKLDKAQGKIDDGCTKPCLIFWLLHLCCLQGCVGCSSRRQLRNRFNLEGTDVNACLSYTICSCLSVVQDANEFRAQTDAALTSPTQAPAQQKIEKA